MSRLAARLIATVAIVVALAGAARADAPTMGVAPAGAVAERATGVDLPVRRERGRVVVRAEAGLEDAANEVAARADQELAAISDDLRGLPTPAHAEIRLVNDADDMPRAAPHGAEVPPWAAGVAFPGEGVVVVAAWRGPNRIDVDGTVDHELAHLALGAALGDHAPRWLHEGFAYLHSGPDWSFERSETLAGMAWFGSAIPLDQLELGFPAEELPASRAYAESYDFVAFLARRGRSSEADAGDRYPFRDFLSRVARGEDLDDAAFHAYGRPLHALFDEWHADLKDRLLFMPLGMILMSLWLFAALLLVLAWRRRRRQNRARIAEWDAIERAARERDAAEQAPRTVTAVPIWAGPAWAPPGAPVSEPELSDADDVDAVLDDDDDAPPRPPPPPRPLN